MLCFMATGSSFSQNRHPQTYLVYLKPYPELTKPCPGFQQSTTKPYLDAAVLHGHRFQLDLPVVEAQQHLGHLLTLNRRGCG
jgi:hypothetical protein